MAIIRLHAVAAKQCEENQCWHCRSQRVFDSGAHHARDIGLLGRCRNDRRIGHRSQVIAESCARQDRGEQPYGICAQNQPGGKHQRAKRNHRAITGTNRRAKRCGEHERRADKITARRIRLTTEPDQSVDQTTDSKYLREHPGPEPGDDRHCGDRVRHACENGIRILAPPAAAQQHAEGEPADHSQDQAVFARCAGNGYRNRPDDEEQ